LPRRLKVEESCGEGESLKLRGRKWKFVLSTGCSRPAGEKGVEARVNAVRVLATGGRNVKYAKETER